MSTYTGYYYTNRTTYDLNVLRSKKYNKLAKLKKEPDTYFNLHERVKLAHQLREIDAVLDARKLQQRLNM